MTPEIKALFDIRDYYMDNEFHLEGTRFWYDRDAQHWFRKNNNGFLTRSYFDTVHVLDLVLNDPEIKDEIKTRIIFNLDELRKL